MCVDSSTIIYNKTPELKDVFQLLRAKSAYWYDIGRELGVSLNDCVGLQRDLSLTIMFNV